MSSLRTRPQRVPLSDPEPPAEGRFCVPSSSAGLVSLGSWERAREEVRGTQDTATFLVMNSTDLFIYLLMIEYVALQAKQYGGAGDVVENKKGGFVPYRI